MKQLNNITRLWPYLVIILFGVGVYSNTFQADFHFDDYTYIVDKQEIRQLFDIKAIYKALGHPSRFIAFFTFALNYHIHGYNVVGYHLINLLIHLINGGLVYGFVQLAYQTPAVKQRPRRENRQMIALCSALLFVTHPMQTQAVTYIVQRFTSLAALFYLLAVVFYVKARLVDKPKNRWFTIGFLVATILGMFTKQICFTIPMTILLVEIVLFNNDILSFLRQRGWMLIILLLLLLIVPSFFGFNVQSILLRELPSRSHAGDILTTKTYFLTQLRVVLTYIKLLLVPIGQTLDYDFPASTGLADLKVILSAIGLMLIGWAAISMMKVNRLIAFGMMWFFITIAVTSSVIPIAHVIFEHRVYLPSLGFVLAFNVGLYQLTKSSRVYITIMSVILVTFSVLTFQRNTVWRTDISLWLDIVKKAPNKVRVHNNLAMAFLRQGEYQRSISFFNKALALNPQAARVYNNRGLAYMALSENLLALNDFNKAAHLYYNSQKYREGVAKRVWAEVFNNRGDLFMRQKKYDFALTDYQEAYRIDPKNEHILYNLGYMSEIKGNYEQAADYYQKALRINPKIVKPYIGLGFIQQTNQREKEAIAFFDQALTLDPANGEAYFYRAVAYYGQGKKLEASADMRQSMNLGYQAGSQELKNLREKILNTVE